MKLLLDMNVSPEVAVLLRSAGHEAVHWSQLGEITARDIDISLVAATDGYVVVTHDLDFSAYLASRNSTAPSVIQIRADDLTPKVLAAKLSLVMSEFGQELADGALITLDLLRARVRVLPIIRQ